MGVATDVVCCGNALCAVLVLHYSRPITSQGWYLGHTVNIIPCLPCPTHAPCLPWPTSIMLTGCWRSLSDPPPQAPSLGLLVPM